MTKKTTLAIPAGTLSGGDIFRKRTGTTPYLVIGEAAAAFMKLDPEKIHGIDAGGRTTGVTRDTLVVRCRSLDDVDDARIINRADFDELRAAADAHHSEIAVKDDMIVDLNADIREARERLLDIAHAAIPRGARRMDLVIGSHTCPDPDDPRAGEKTPNPIGVCVYDYDNDPMQDFCLFCGYPDERK